ncbi:unnamed protein product [Haemonchus placei]|uniref:Apple domain-containing protein n=1 Tax=Haemonchus placei TaxID=6290 RepID=A0A158QP16_HAEPC|nr:unnamed protein product [Haemonchus placei]
MTEPPPPKWNTDNRTSGGHGGHHKVQSKTEWRFAIPEAESEEEGSSSKKSTSTAPLTITTEQPKMRGDVTPDDFVGDPSEFVPPQNAEHIDVRYPSRLPGVQSLKYGTKRKKLEKVETSTTTTTTTTATTSTVTTTDSDSSSESEEESVLAYPPVGRCTYSAMYQTAFQGTKMIRSIYVKSPADCFAACYAHSCRSANLISSGQCFSILTMAFLLCAFNLFVFHYPSE